MRRCLRFYPEDAGKKCSGPWNALRWRVEVPANLAGPMVRVHLNARTYLDYFANEPCLIKHGPKAKVMPAIALRWIEHGGQLWGLMCLLRVSGNSYVLAQHLEIPIDDLFLPFPLFATNHLSYGLPPPTHFKGVCLTDSTMRDSLLMTGIKIKTSMSCLSKMSGKLKHTAKFVMSP